MDIQLKYKPFLIFDLDDTLYNEINFLKSAFFEISHFYVNVENNVLNTMLELYQQKKDVFEYLTAKYPSLLSKEDLIILYREHYPNISLFRSAKTFIEKCASHHIPMGLITDGRSISQRNKLKALKIKNCFDRIIISEELGSDKHHERNFNIFELEFKGYQFYYFGDNMKKDFMIPNRLGWKTVGILDNGENIHTQDMSLSHEYHPQFWIKGFDEIEFIR